MSKIEAQTLAAELGFIKPNSSAKFLDAVEAKGLILGIDNKNGSWVILAADRETVLARVA